MNKECYNVVIAEMKAVLDEQKFEYVGEIFKNDSKAVKVYYNEENSTFNLGLAEINEGVVGDFTVANSWLFDSEQTEKDAVSVGIDFADTLRKSLGIKRTTRSNTREISLPTTQKGDEVTLTTLTQKLLAIFTQYKETYKAEVSLYGKFLYVDFYAKYFIPEIRRMLTDGANKKQLKKLFDMLDEMYVEGDSATTDAVVMVIAAAAYNDEKATETAKKQMSENSHMNIAVSEFTKRIKASKKLREAIIR